MATKKEVKPVTKKEKGSLSSALKACAKHLTSLLKSADPHRATVAKASGSNSPAFKAVAAAIEHIETLSKEMGDKAKAVTKPAKKK